MASEKKTSEGLPAMRAIQAFEAIARCGSVAGAADELGVSPGAVSQQLRKIEKELNARLFERDGRSLTLTSWGRIYYDKIHPAFDQLRSAQHVLQQARSKQSIVLSALPSLAVWLRRHLLTWRNRHPGVNVLLVGSEREPSLQDESIDFRLCYGSDARQYDRFSELFIDAVVPACSPEFLRSHPVANEADILAAPRIDISWKQRHRPAPSWAEWAWAFGAKFNEGPSDLAFSLSDAAIGAAIDGGGFVMGQISMIANHVRSGALVVPLDRRLSMPEPYYLAWERDALDRPCGAEFRNMLIAAGRQQVEISTGKTPLTAATR
jgi:LysR family transcriptional regulator, glycine cleavage system transcriptional activator